MNSKTTPLRSVLIHLHISHNLPSAIALLLLIGQCLFHSIGMVADSRATTEQAHCASWKSGLSNRYYNHRVKVGYSA
jgi:hypothetical protein